MTFAEAKQGLCRKLGIDYSDIANNDLFTDDDLESYIQAGIDRAWDYKRWPFAESGGKTLTLSAAQITAGYIDMPSDLMMGSIYLMTVDGKGWSKKTYDTYLKYFEDHPGDDAKIWTEHAGFMFFNINATSAGKVMDVYGKKKAPHPISESDLLPFSQDTDNEEHSGNQAIVLLAYAEALSSEKKKNPNQATIEEKRALMILEYLWKPFSEDEANEQPINKPMLDVPDFFGPGGGASSSNTGKFDY